MGIHQGHTKLLGHLWLIYKNIIHGREYNTSGQAPTAPNPPKKKAVTKGSTHKKAHLCE